MNPEIINVIEKRETNRTISLLIWLPEPLMFQSSLSNSIDCEITTENAGVSARVGNVDND